MSVVQKFRKMRPFISLIIPTYDRPNYLKQALVSAQVQTVDAQQFEVILVDNSSTGKAKRVAEEANMDGLHVIRYVHEPKLGLHNARHAGARAAKGDILVFTDDDATFEPGWLEAYERAFVKHPEMAAAGGPVRPIWEAPPPKWLLTFMDESRIFPILSLMEPYQEFRIDPRGFFFGVNMAIRRKVLFEVGGFNPESFGDIWLGDGETGLNRKLWKQGMLIGYVPKAVVYHHIPPQRMTVEYFCRRMANEGACDMYAHFHQGMDWPKLIKTAGQIFIRNILFWIGAFLVRGRTDVLSLRVQLSAARTRAQVKYVVRLMLSKDLRQLVTKQDWLNDLCGSA